MSVVCLHRLEPKSGPSGPAFATLVVDIPPGEVRIGNESGYVVSIADFCFPSAPFAMVWRVSARVVSDSDPAAPSPGVPVAGFPHAIPGAPRAVADSLLERNCPGTPIPGGDDPRLRYRVTLLTAVVDQLTGAPSPAGPGDGWRLAVRFTPNA